MLNPTSVEGKSAKGAPGEETSFEDQHVHQVYEQIAAHFSATRYKPWPVVDDFLRSQAAGAVGLDIGCGNGKYLTVNKNVFIVASDRSRALVKIARQHQPHSSIVADTLNLPHPAATFDFAISIAVVHHLSSPERRVEAIRTTLHTLKPASASTGGEALFFVWALEQKNSRRAWDTGDEQDVLVPWVLKPDHNIVNKAPKETTFQRYYHLYQQGELERDIQSAGGTVHRSGYDRDNWWAVARKDSASFSHLGNLA